MADGRPILVMISGAHRVDTAALAGRIGKKRIVRADADEVRTATGQAIGGVAPLGHPTRLETLIDTALSSYDEIWAAGGTPHAIFATTYDELIHLTQGTEVQVD
jgi:prolyl-tRNA editing enzyme YbaK/EbsC (Cys-tRNA(Pro) deacylase)